ncbi:MAG: hypothetical protein PHF76_12170 [Bacteroidales bacterium]|nr:hypothetical protein [Bacteroidales bacterium]
MYKKINYAIGNVASTTAIGATTLTLKAGHTITTDTGATNKFIAVFYDGTKSSPYQDTNREIVEAYRTDTNDFVIARAKENTSAKQWVENDKFMLIASAGVFNEYETEIASKQDSLGYTAENSANKKTDLSGNSDTYYPTQKAVKTAVDLKQDALGYTAENAANKKTSLTDNSDTYYPSQKAVKTAVDAKQDALTFGIANTNAVKVDDASVADNDYAKFTANGIEGVPYSTVLSDIGAQAALGYTPENVANKETTALDTSTTKYPCNNVVKEAVDAKQDSLGYIAENVANKKTSLTDNSDTYYPTQKAVKTAVDSKVNLDQTTPQTITDGSPLFSEGVDMANDKWLKSKDYAGTGYLNILKGNEDNEVDVGTQLNVGSIEAEEDSGAISLFDMAVSSASADGTEMSATIKIDGNNILKIYAESDGAGGADTFKVQLLNKAVLTMQDSAGTTHTYMADTDGSLNIT